MLHLLHKPAFPLSSYVDTIWWADNPNEPSSRKCIYPDGAMALVVHLRRRDASFIIDDVIHKIATPLLAGPYSRSFHIDPSQSTGAIVVRFRPGAATMFYPIAAHELHNVDIPLSQFNPREADQLLNEVCSAPDARMQIAKVEQYLFQKLATAPPLHPALHHAVALLSRHGGAGIIRRAQQDVCLSHTRFIQLFREHVGLTPKLFHRVRRFRTVLDHIDNSGIVSWAELATTFGYYDQAHFIRDFRALAAVTPSEYCRPTDKTGRSAPIAKG